MNMANDTLAKRDDRILEDVMHGIEFQPEVKSKDVRVKVMNGTVVLTGFVHTYLEKLAVERAAKAVYGVICVINDIEVKPNSERTDPEIARDVAVRLQLHASIPNEKLTMTVRDGLVILEGAVCWNFQRVDAEREAQSVAGVRGVENRIAILPGVSPQEVEKKIEQSWKRTNNLDTRGITVIANNGWVSLYGHVHSWNEKEQAEKAAWQAPGVQQVTNLLVINP